MTSEDLVGLTFEYCALLNALDTHYALAPPGTRLFLLTTKAHWLAHSSLMSRYVNPRTVWCYRAEDFMQHVRRLWQSSSRGSGLAQTSGKFAKMYANALHLRLKEGDSLV